MTPVPRHYLLLGLTVLALGAGCASDPPAEHTDAEAELPALPPEPPPTFGLDSVMLDAAVAHASELTRLRTLLVARHGEVLVEEHFRGPGLTDPHNVKSVSKSVVSALVGIAIAEGHLSGADQPIGTFFTRYLAGESDSRKPSITLAQLLSMQSGLERTSGSNYGSWVTSRDWIGYALGRPMVADPGTQRLYSTGNSHLLSAIITQATSQSTLAYAREVLGEPLGISIPGWSTDPQGIYFGGNEMRMTPRAMLAFGELYRNRGRAPDGTQVVPEAWVRESLVSRVAARGRGEGYGYSWFLSNVRGHEMFYAWGYGGQFIFVIPGLELTVVTTSDPNAPRGQEHNREIRRLLAERIVPAAERGDGGRGQ
ncbi:MAG: serine hydrolase [Gemmatimonadota bacterium]